MKKMKRVIIMVAVSAILFNSCHKSGAKLGNYIPKDAYVIFTINSKSLIDKSSKANLSFDSISRVFADEGDDTSFKKAEQNWDDIKNSGIDLDQQMFGFVKNGGSIMAGQSAATGFVFALKDVSAFEKFLKKQKPAGEIKKADNYSYLALGEDFIAGWSDNVAIIAQKKAGSFSPGTYATGEGTVTQQMLTTLFTQKESESANSVKGFEELSGDKNDMAFFINSENQSASPLLGMTKFSDISKGSYMIASANFDDGKISLALKSHSGDAMKDLFAKYPYRAVNMDMVDKYPSPIEGLILVSFDPQLISGLVKFLGLDAMANSGMQQTGLNFTLDDVTKTFNGDFALIGSDFGMTTKTISSYGGYQLPNPVTTEVPQYKLILNAGIADKVTYNKIAGSLADKGWMVGQNGDYQIPTLSAAGFAMKVTDKNFYIASSPELLQQYEGTSANKNSLPADVRSKIEGKAGAVYFNINQILNAIPAPSGDDDKMALEKSKAVFKDIVATFDVPKGNESTGLAEIRLLNDKENSLAAMLRYFVEMGKLEKDRMHLRSLNSPMVDSSTIEQLPPPPPTK